MEPVTLSREEYERLHALEVAYKASKERWKEAGRRFAQEHPEKRKEIKRRYYEKVKGDPEKLQERRLYEGVAYARRRLDDVGYVTTRTKPEVVAALGLVWDADNNRWVLPNTTPTA